MTSETEKIEVEVGAVVIRHNTVLLLKRNTPPKQGLWSIPIGPLQIDLSLQASMERYLSTTCGIDVKGGRPLYNRDLIVPDDTGKTSHHRLTLFLEGKYRAGEPAAAGVDVEDVAWVSVEAMEFMEIDEEALLLLEALGFLVLEEE